MFYLRSSLEYADTQLAPDVNDPDIDRSDAEPSDEKTSDTSDEKRLDPEGPSRVESSDLDPPDSDQNIDLSGTSSDGSENQQEESIASGPVDLHAPVVRAPTPTPKP